MECVASTPHTTSEHGVPSITTADAHTSAAQQSAELTPPGRFKWTRPFLRNTNSGFCACAITFQTQSTYLLQYMSAILMVSSEIAVNPWIFNLRHSHGLQFKSWTVSRAILYARFLAHTAKICTNFSKQTISFRQTYFAINLLLLSLSVLNMLYRCTSFNI